jgi:hypothetical protein
MNKIILVIILTGLLVFGCTGQRPAAPAASATNGAVAGNASASGSGPGSTAGVASGVSESESRTFWASTTPFAITAWKYSGTELDLTIQQDGSEAQEIVFTGITGTNGLSYAQNITLAFGETKTVAIIGMADCGASGAPFDISNVHIVYNRGGIYGLREISTKDIIGTCS